MFPADALESSRAGSRVITTIPPTRPGIMDSWQPPDGELPVQHTRTPDAVGSVTPDAARGWQPG